MLWDVSYIELTSLSTPILIATTDIILNKPYKNRLLIVFLESIR
jgi:hypothetical protein